MFGGDPPPLKAIKSDEKDAFKRELSNSSLLRSKNEKEDEIRRFKDDLQLKLRQDEETLKRQLSHDHKIRCLQLKRRKLLLLHVLEQKLFEEVCFIKSNSSKIHFLYSF